MKHKVRLRVLADGTVIECDGHTPSEEMLRLMSAINSNKLEKSRSAAGAKFLSVALWIIGIFVVFIALCLIVPQVTVGFIGLQAVKDLCLR